MYKTGLKNFTANTLSKKPDFELGKSKNIHFLKEVYYWNRLNFVGKVIEL